MLYPVSEIFTSPQGEGLYAGTRMLFVRLAGCNVGKPYPKERYEKSYLCKNCSGLKSSHEDATYRRTVCCDGYQPSDQLAHPVFPIYQEECTTWDGRKFPCDTDYRVKERLTVEEILSRVPEGVSHLCVSGGEPLIHDLAPLHAGWIKRVGSADKSFHIETSGTRKIPMWMRDSYIHSVWITVSPKFGCLQNSIFEADELKLLVDEHFNEEKAIDISERFDRDLIIWISPINNETTLNMDNVKRCIEIQQRHPTWRITMQMHKILGVR